MRVYRSGRLRGGYEIYDLKGTKTSEFKKHYEHRREEDRMEKAEKQARDAIRKPPQRRPEPPIGWDWK